MRFEHRCAPDQALSLLCSFSARWRARYRPLRPSRSTQARPALRRARARVRAQGVSEQDRARARGRCGRAAAARADAGVLRLLRLAFVGARALAARAARAAVSRSGDCERRPRGARGEPHAGEHRARRWSICAATGRSSFERPYGLAWLLRSPPNCAAGTIRRPAPGWRRWHRSRRRPPRESRAGCRSCTTRSASASTARRRSRSG